MGYFKQWHTIRGVPVLQFTQRQKQRVNFAESQKERMDSDLNPKWSSGGLLFNWINRRVDREQTRSNRCFTNCPQSTCFRKETAIFSYYCFTALKVHHNYQVKLIYLHSSYRTNLKPREEGEEKMKFSFWRCFSIFVRWPHNSLLFTSSLLISSEKYSTTFSISYVLESHFEIVFFCSQQRGLLRDMCDTTCTA